MAKSQFKGFVVSLGAFQTVYHKAGVRHHAYLLLSEETHQKLRSVYGFSILSVRSDAPRALPVSGVLAPLFQTKKRRAKEPFTCLGVRGTQQIPRYCGASMCSSSPVLSSLHLPHHPVCKEPRTAKLKRLFHPFYPFALRGLARGCLQKSTHNGTGENTPLQERESPTDFTQHNICPFFTKVLPFGGAQNMTYCQLLKIYPKGQKLQDERKEGSWLLGPGPLALL